MTDPDERQIVSALGAETVIDRYVDEFVSDIDVSDVSVREFDRLIRANGGSQESLVWGSVGGFSKHLVFLPDSYPDARIAELRTHVRQLNLRPTAETVEAFGTYLRTHFESFERLPDNALVEIPAPTATKMGEYPVVNVVLYGNSDAELVEVVEVTLESSGFTVDRREEVMERVGQKTPVGNVERYAETVHDDIIDTLAAKLTANVVRGLTADTLEAAGYRRQSNATVPESVQPLHGGADAAYWQKELWAVDGVDASTGFARVWLVPAEQVGVVQPTKSDVDDAAAIRQMRAELAEHT